MARPTKYKPSYCDDLIAHMEQGLSFQSFAGKCRVSIQTIYDWSEKHKEFLDAKKIGEGLSLLMWEKIGIKGTLGQIPNYNATSYIYETSNRFPNYYKRNGERSVEVTKEGSKLVIDFSE